MPGVAMKEFTPSRTTTNPLATSTASPASRATVTATMTLYPSCWSFETRTTDSASWAATERSNMPAAIGMMSANARRAVIACWSATLLKVCDVRNVSGSHTPNTTIRIAMT